jgi:malonate-semialdehyde dehydrogenase (acetylating) / methylmalonate-semialdehyde dehydrogenase
MAASIAHFIDGALTPGGSGRTTPVFNPATGEQTGVVHLASKAEVDAAIVTARRASLPGRARRLCGGRVF